jgi:hypothetical protein
VQTLDEVRHSKKDALLVSPLRLVGSFDGILMLFCCTSIR